MKILMTADAVGGVWTYAHTLCRALASHDIQVVLAVMGPAPNDAQRRMMERLANVWMTCGDFRLEWMEQPWPDITRAGEWLLQLAHDECIDVVHLNGYAHAALDWRVPRLLVAHSCVCSWWEAVHGAPAPPEWNRYRAMVAAGLRAADAVVAPTRSFLNDISRLHGVARRTRVIHNAAPSTSVNRSEARDPIVFACGRAWDEAKNVRRLEAAARSLNGEVYVAGAYASPDGRRMAFGSLQALDALAPDVVHAWMSRAAVFVHPALYEPFGLAVLEAAQRGCALVLSDLPTLRELWKDVALFADPRAPQAFAMHMQHLLDDPVARATWANAAQLRAVRFKPEAMAQAYVSLYRTLITDCSTGWAAA
jgi:glycosyltransferase involved in cell wall biosynthesis